MITMVNLVADLMLFLALLISLSFSLLYLTRSPWKTTKAGKAVAIHALSWAWVLLNITLTTWVGADYEGRPYVRLFSFSSVTITGLYLLCTLMKIQYRGGRKITS